MNQDFTNYRKSFDMGVVLDSNFNVEDFEVFSILVSLVFCIYYELRYKKLSKGLKNGYSADFSSLRFLLIALNFWNVALSIHIVSINHNLFSSRSNPYEDISASNESNEESDIGLQNGLENQQLGKDMKIWVIILISMVLLNLLCKSVLKVVEYVFSASETNQSEVESSIGLSNKSHKVVSFDEKLITFEYSDVGLTVMEGTIGKKLLRNFSMKKLVFKYILPFCICLALSTYTLPRSFLSNSATVIWYSEDESFTSDLTFDHIYFSTFALYVVHVSWKFIQLMKHPRIYNFPQLTLICSAFTWCYACLIMSVSMCLMIRFRDVLQNISNLIADDSSVETYLQNGHHLHIFTYIIINYLSHSIKPNDCNICSTQASIDIISNTFIWLKHIFANIWLVLNTSCFAVLPFFIWCLLVEFKLKNLRYTHSI